MFKNHGLVASQNGLADSLLKVSMVASKPAIIVFSSYTTLSILRYGDRMGKMQEACHRAEQEGISFQKAQQMVESDLFLDEYPRWDLEPCTGL